MGDIHAITSDELAAEGLTVLTVKVPIRLDSPVEALIDQVRRDVPTAMERAIRARFGAEA